MNGYIESKIQEGTPAPFFDSIEKGTRNYLPLLVTHRHIWIDCL